ncbi:MAG: o-succinylbenzoate synthase [Candidatus Zixiibacteriota bacterium]
MKVTEFQIHSFELPLRKPLKLKESHYQSRKGLLISLTDERNNRSYGEVSPLAGFSRETLPEALKSTLALRRSTLNNEVPANLHRLDGGFEQWLTPFSSIPSVRFGVETAVLRLIALREKTSLAHLLNHEPLESVTVNALLAGSTQDVLEKARLLIDDGFTTFKLKVGDMSVKQALELTEAVRAKIGNAAFLRLDANRSWGIAEALEFMKRAGGLAVEFIEEPVHNLNQLRKLLQEKGCTMPVALDESLLEIRPRDLDPSYGIKAIVIKPGLLGFERAMLFTRSAVNAAMDVIISASFESSVGLSAMVSLSASVAKPNVAMGFDTLEWFDRDLSAKPIRITKGKIDLSTSDQAAREIQADLLEEVKNDPV